jgi:hypothetical protein
MKDLPVPVREAAHYRVHYRPSVHERERVPLRDLWEIIERNKLRLRGWDFPHISPKEDERKLGTNWIASWSSFMGHIEYWQFFQSTQFVYLGSVREMRPDWSEKLAASLGPNTGESSNIRGFVSIVNFIYNVTEFFEFPTRLCQAGVYQGPLSITLEMNHIHGFALATDDPRRHWWRRCQANEDSLSNTWTIESSDLVARSQEHSLNAMIWYLERFNWLDVSREALKADQDDFLSGRF